MKFEPGDKVLLNSKNIKFKKVGKVGSKKFMPKWIGPFTVVKMVGQAAVQLLLPSQYRIHDVFHVSLLSKYRESGRVQPPAPVEELEDGPVWKVGKVLTHKWTRVAGKILTDYLVQWEDQSPEQATWVTEANMNVRDVEDYWAQTMDDKPSPSPKLGPDGISPPRSISSPDPQAVDEPTDQAPEPSDQPTTMENTGHDGSPSVPVPPEVTGPVRKSERLANKPRKQYGLKLIQEGCVAFIQVQKVK